MNEVLTMERQMPIVPVGSRQVSGPPAAFDLSLEQWTALLTGWGEPAYRARQICDWLYKRLANSPDEMSNLPRGLRQKLAAEIAWKVLTPVAEQHSSDGETNKLLFELREGQTIETVLMRYAGRRTTCISTQAGCAMGCVFCATGQMGLARNLTAGEIIGQALYFARKLRDEDDTLTNIVLMGMGEPLHNFTATVAALRRLIDPAGFNFGARRITISTVGLVPAIERFTQEGLQVGLAVSLHAATNEMRSQLLPINRRYPLEVLLPACHAYVDRTHRRITFEWALIQDVNDTPDQARALGDLARNLLCHVNLIPLNPTQGYAGGPSQRERVAVFRAILAEAGIPSTVRVRRGIDIQAGCGQLNTERQARVAARPPAPRSFMS